MPETKRKPWVMPKWMEPYRHLIGETGGNTIEDMVNDTTVVQVNAPRALLATAVAAQVALLERLHTVGEAIAQSLDKEAVEHAAIRDGLGTGSTRSYHDGMAEGFKEAAALLRRAAGR